MLGFLKSKNKKGSEVTFKIEGMHCTSCAMNIDGNLEDLEGVISADTSYATSRTQVIYDETKLSKKDLIASVKKTGYIAKEIN